MRGEVRIEKEGSDPSGAVRTGSQHVFACRQENSDYLLDFPGYEDLRNIIYFDIKLSSGSLDGNAQI